MKWCKDSDQQISEHSLLLKLRRSALLLAGLTSIGVGVCRGECVITNRTHLENIGRFDHCVLGSDIDLSDAPWTPLFKNIDQGFSGTLESKGYAIDGMHIDSNNGDNQAFMLYLGGDSVLELRLNNANVTTTGSTSSTTVALGVASVRGSNNTLTLRVRNSQVDAQGSGIHELSLMAGEVELGSNNRLSLLDTQAVNVTSGIEQTSNYAALGVAQNFGSNTTLTLKHIHNVRLETATQFVCGALADQSTEGSIDVSAEKISGLTLISRSGSNSYQMGILAGRALFNQGPQSTFRAQAVSGELSYQGSSNNINDALAAGWLQGSPSITGSFLGVNTDSSGSALIDAAGSVDCTGAHWDISRNGRLQSGCQNDSGKGYRSHTPDGWNDLWLLLAVDPYLQVPGEEQRNPQGNAALLVTRQTYHNQIHEDGYYDENQVFQPNGTGPLILRSLTLLPGHVSLIFGFPKAVNITTDPDGLWQHNQTHLTALNLENNEIRWQTLNLDTRTLGPVNTNPLEGKVLAYDAEQVFTYIEVHNSIRRYTLSEDQPGFKDYATNHRFNPQASFAIGLDNNLIQAENTGNGQVIIGSALALTGEDNPVMVTYPANDYRLIVEPDPQDSQSQQVILIPTNALRLNGRTVQVREPEYPWQNFEQIVDLNDTTATLAYAASAIPTPSLLSTASSQTTASPTVTPGTNTDPASGAAALATTGITAWAISLILAAGL